MQPFVSDHDDDDNYLEDGLVVPVGVDLPQLARDPVVLPHKQGVEHRQHLEVIFNFNCLVIWLSKGTPDGNIRKNILLP